MLRSLGGGTPTTDPAVVANVKHSFVGRPRGELEHYDRERLERRVAELTKVMVVTEWDAPEISGALWHKAARLFPYPARTCPPVPPWRRLLRLDRPTTRLSARLSALADRRRRRRASTLASSRKWSRWGRSGSGPRPPAASSSARCETENPQSCGAAGARHARCVVPVFLLGVLVTLPSCCFARSFPVFHSPRRCTQMLRVRDVAARTSVG